MEYATRVKGKISKIVYKKKRVKEDVGRIEKDVGGGGGKGVRGRGA